MELATCLLLEGISCRGNDGEACFALRHFLVHDVAVLRMQRSLPPRPRPQQRCPGLQRVEASRTRVACAGPAWTPRSSPLLIASSFAIRCCTAKMSTAPLSRQCFAMACRTVDGRDLPRFHAVCARPSVPTAPPPASTLASGVSLVAGQRRYARGPRSSCSRVLTWSISTRYSTRWNAAIFAPPPMSGRRNPCLPNTAPASSPG